jgi:hypothetical protein
VKAVLVLAAALVLSACSLEVAGHKVLGGGENKSQNFSYELEQNGCKTGRHEFSSQDDYCNGLKNDALNNYCAINLRYEEFKAKCADKSWNN